MTTECFSLAMLVVEDHRTTGPRGVICSDNDTMRHMGAGVTAQGGERWPTLFLSFKGIVLSQQSVTSPTRHVCIETLQGDNWTSHPPRVN